MPKNVRNFFLDLGVDGRNSDVRTGPVAPDGGMAGVLYIRRNGEVCEAASISCVAFADGSLEIRIACPDGRLMTIQGER